MESRSGHDFSKVRVHSDTRATESTRDINAIAYPLARDRGIGRGQFPPGTTPETPTPETPQPTPMDEKPQSPTPIREPIPMDNPPAQGPAIAVTNGWANPAGKQDRTTVGIGELNSFVVSDFAGGSWKSADGNGKTTNSVTFQWTASAAGKNTITYTAADKSHLQRHHDHGGADHAQRKEGQRSYISRKARKELAWSSLSPCRPRPFRSKPWS